MTKKTLKKQAVSGIIWSSIERFSVQGLQFIIMIIMARILSPRDYGLVGMLTIFIAISQSLIDSGFSQALIRKQNRTNIDNSTVFFFNILIGIILYVIFFLIAPYVSLFYHTTELTLLMRVISIGVIFNSLAIVQRALFTIDLNFKIQAKASLTATIISGIIGITMAYKGYGVWSIVIQQLVNLGCNTVLLWILAQWRPILVFSQKSFNELFSFGSKLLASGLLDTIYRNIYLIVIGKFFSASTLGYYTRSQQFSDFPSANLTGIMQRVTYPVLCKIQNNNEQLANVYRKFIRVSAFVIFPLMLGLSAVSKPFIIIILKEQWIFSATLLQILCFSGMWYPIHAINLSLLQVKGRSDLILKIEIIKKINGIIILCITIPLGLISMCYGQIISCIISFFINTYYTGKLLKLGFIKQIKDLSHIIVLSFSMWGLIHIIVPYINGYINQLIICICTGIIYYLGIAYIFKFSEFKELISIIRKK